MADGDAILGGTRAARRPATGVQRAQRPSTGSGQRGPSTGGLSGVRRAGCTHSWCTGTGGRGSRPRSSPRSLARLVARVAPPDPDSRSEPPLRYTSSLPATQLFHFGATENRHIHQEVGQRLHTIVKQKSCACYAAKKSRTRQSPGAAAEITAGFRLGKRRSLLQHTPASPPDRCSKSLAPVCIDEQTSKAPRVELRTARRFAEATNCAQACAVADRTSAELSRSA